MPRWRRSPTLRRLAAWAVGALPVLLFAARALARAGGGEHFSGGGFHSSGGYHSSGGWSGGGSSGSGSGAALGELLYLAIQLTIDHPLVMGPVWVGVLVVVVAKNTRYFDPDPEPARPIRALDRARTDFSGADDGLAKLRARDPAFDETAFLGRVRVVFHEVQEAWFLRRLENARRFMSDGLYRRFATLETLMKLERRRDAIGDDKVLRARLAAVDETPAFDVLTVRIDASIRDTEVPDDLEDDEAREAAKGARPETFTELWTFVRRAGAKTKAEAGYDPGQGRCPNCGADFHGGETNRCEYCDAVVNSGNYDWVLAEITQLSEFVRPTRAVPGFDALAAKDPDAAPEILEDRALLLFWKWLHALAVQEPAIVRKVARASMVDEVRSQLDLLHARGLSPVVKVPAVGGADVVAVETDDDGFDRVHVDLRWSGIVALEPTDSLGRLAKRPRRHVLTMVRRSDAKTDRGTGLATERCPNCEAPLTDSDSTTCDHCGAELADGGRDWVLDALVPYDSWRRPSALGAPPPVDPAHVFATRSERTRLLHVLAALAKADGVIDAGERRLLRQCALRWGVRRDEVEVLLEGGSSFSLEGLDRIPPAQAEELVDQLRRMVATHGRIHPNERALLAECARRLKITPERARELVG